MNHDKTSSVETRRNVDEAFENIRRHLKVLTRIYPDCETNSTVVNELLGLAVCIRLEHMVNHDAKPSDSDLADNMEAMIDIVQRAWTAAAPLAIKKGPQKPMDGHELLKEIIALVASLKSDKTRFDDKFGTTLNKKDLH